MAEEFDINEVIAAFLKQNIESFFDTGKDVLKHGADKIRLHLDRTYTSYLKCVLERHSRSKSFFIRDEAAYLYSFYVPLNLRYGNKIIKGPSMADIAKISRCTTIVASGGSGKSMFMRHLLLNSVLSKAKVPIFIELRQFNETKSNLVEAINQTLAANKFEMDPTYVEKALKAGHFLIILDGFDELDRSRRAEVTKWIQELSRNYDQNSIVLSSRVDRELEGWPDFALMHLKPLTLDLAYQLVTKLPYDEDLKKVFLKDLRAGLFEKHRSFLSNPLLLSIMMLTHGQSAHIPNKLNVFYNQAYEALFERHDALKGGFQRRRKTRLDVQDFAKLFSAFCIQSYDKRKFEFTRVEALAFIEKAMVISGIKCDKDDYLKDAMQAVCLMIEDGLSIIFSHRSFQEYFAARFIAETVPGKQEALIKKYSVNVRTDDVMFLLHEMRPEVIEKYYLIPKLKELFDFLEVTDDVRKEHHARFIKEGFSRFDIEEINLTGFRNEDSKYSFGDVASFAFRSCAHLCEWKEYELKQNKNPIEKLFWKKYTENGEETLILTKNLTEDSPFMKDLAEKSTFFSLEALQRLLKVYKGLVEKTSKAEASLEEILGKN